jgi:hypothetical protein
MSIVAVFDAPDMKPENYDNAMKDMGLNGIDKAPGLISHVCSIKEGGGMQVVDIWESMEAFAVFGEKLVPTLIKNGITPPQPQISQVHNRLK